MPAYEEIDTGLGAKSQMHKQIVEQANMTTMGILNIDASAEMAVSTQTRPNTTAGKLATMQPGVSDAGVIQELSEENMSQSQSVKRKVNFEDGGRMHNDALLKTYQRVDNVEMLRSGLGHKADMSIESGALKSAMQYSLAQRFRRGKDLCAIDKTRPPVDDQERQELRDRENQWYRDNILTDDQKAVENKSKVEKRRYIGALKALIKEKGAKLNPLSEDVPALCGCGAM